MIKLFLVLPIAVALKTCGGQTMVLQESCTVLQQILYPNGEFILQPQEVAGLRRENKEKLVTLKKYYTTKCL